MAIIGPTFRKLRRMRKAPGYKTPQSRLFNSAVWASLAAYLVGAAFASTAMVVYTSALHRVAFSKEPNDGARPGRAPKAWMKVKIEYERTE